MTSHGTRWNQMEPYEHLWRPIKLRGKLMHPRDPVESCCAYKSELCRAQPEPRDRLVLILRRHLPVKHAFGIVFPMLVSCVCSPCS